MRIKNWTKFQHFKDRRPPWVKLYRDILDDLEWHELDPLAAKVLVMLWLIASENEGQIPDNKTLAFRLRLTEVKTKEIIIKLSHWLEQDDINKISKGYQVDLPETETETEREIETDLDAIASLSSTKLPDCPHKQILNLYKKHLSHLSQPRVWEGNRQVNLKNRWKQAAKPSNYSPEGYKTLEDGLKWWDSFFAYIANDTKLATGFQSKERTWHPDLEWIVNATNFAKIIDGKYAK
jgi:hypothetical protein